MYTLEKLMQRVEPVTESGCWIWLGSVTEKGYGRVCFGGKYRKAHRLFYESTFGEIRKGLVIDHICRVRCCVNPHHMQPVSNEENVSRGYSFSALKSRQTHCKYGHVLDGDNIYRPKSRPTRRLCRACIASYKPIKRRSY